MGKIQMSRRSFLKGVAKTAVASVLASILKFVPEAQGVLGSSLTLNEHSMSVGLMPLTPDDPRVNALQIKVIGDLDTNVFGSSIDWEHPYLGSRGSEPTFRREAIAVAFNKKSDSAAIFFLAASIANGQPTRPVVVGFQSNDPNSSQRFSGAITVYSLKGNASLHIRVQDGRLVSTDRSTEACGPGFDSCVQYWYSSCAPYLIVSGLIYAICVSLGIAACMAEHCS